MRRRSSRLVLTVIGLAVVLVLAACSGGEGDTATQVPRPTAPLLPTATPTVSPVPTATPTPSPTATSIATYTPTAQLVELASVSNQHKWDALRPERSGVG